MIDIGVLIIGEHYHGDANHSNDGEQHGCDNQHWYQCCYKERHPMNMEVHCPDATVTIVQKFMTALLLVPMFMQVATSVCYLKRTA